MEHISDNPRCGDEKNNIRQGPKLKPFSPTNLAGSANVTYENNVAVDFNNHPINTAQENVLDQRNYPEEPIPIENPAEEKRPLSNSRALLKEALTYELEKFKENVLIIFNHEEFDNCGKRFGTEIDVKALTKTFTKFGFRVIEHKDLTKNEIIAKLKAFTDSKNDLSKYGCVAVAVLTHGSENGLLRAKDSLYSETEITEYFKVHNNATLVTKPRVIIIQACRGNDSPSGANVHSPGTTFRDFDTRVEQYIVPKEMDMLILYSCYAGHPSYRNDLYGSWFIQELCKKIDKLAPTHDLETIMHEVKREVAIHKYIEEFDEGTSQTNISKQMPVITTTLIRKLFLRSFGEMSLRVKYFVDSERQNISSEVRNELLADATSSKTLLIQLEPSSCFVELYFNFMSTCLKYHIEEKPQDETAIDLLDISKTYGDSAEFHTSKVKISKVMFNHLTKNVKEYQSPKCLRFYYKRE